ncbi:MAG: GNAT family N-acetyltransferase [Agathobacter sp.]|nr:GNAT family N-acetyltransferase [Agathobacter sp.]
MLETKDLIIKQAEQKDWKDMYYNLWRHAESAKYMLWDVTTSEEDAQIRMEKTIAYERNHPYAWFVYEKASGKAIGFAGMIEIEPGIFEDTGVALGPDFVGKGYGKQIVRAMENYVKNDLGAKKMVLSARSQNIASKKVQQACGFVYSHSEEKVDPRTGEHYVLEYTYKEF